MPDTTLNLFGEEVPVPEALRPMSGLSPVEQMRRMYGERRGWTCGKCKHLAHHGKNRSYLKCEKFGITAGPGTDWCAKYHACGLFEATTANSDAHAVSVCVGLINAGSCTARQTSTAVATRPAAADPGPNPWPVILPASVLLMLAVGVIVGALDRLDGER